MDCENSAGPQLLLALTPPNLWAVQLLFEHKKIESTVRYLGIEVDDALAIAEQQLLVDRRPNRGLFLSS
jgi:hypothetical protein